jgi:cytidine deaminase
MIQKEIHTILLEYESEFELEPIDQKLVHQAKLSTDNAYAPYSDFKVGAAVLLENGKIIHGNNQENAAYPSGLCAERVALFFANSNFPDIKVRRIAIAAKKGENFTKLPITPCGSCRQVILESQNRFEIPIKIILYGLDKVQVIEDASTLLPISFNDGFLKYDR